MTSPNFDKSHYTPWENFYERAWNARMDVIKGFIAAGEKHPLRLIRKLDSFQRFNRLDMLKPKPEFELMIPANVVNAKVGDGKCVMMLDKLPTGQPPINTIDFFARHIEIPAYYLKCNAAFLADFLRNERFDAVVELGSGYSRNLIELHYEGGPQVPYYAGEFTESGTEMARILSELSSELNITPFRFDYKNPDLSAVKETGKIFVFTCHSIEQVGEIPSDLLEKIAAHAREVVCVHLEPFGYQVVVEGEASEVDRDHEEFFRTKGWNRNLFEVLMASHDKGKIKIEYLAKNIFGGGYKNPTSIATWRKPEAVPSSH